MNQPNWLGRGVLALALLSLCATASAQQASTSPAERAAARKAQEEAAAREAMKSERPIEALDSVWIEELTWLEVRDAIAAGKTTAILSTGGIEQNGPYVATGKHNYILETACEWIARELGDALCAPILKLVPEGNIDPPTSHMLYPGTISLRNETFEAVLEDVTRSLHAHGFDPVVLIGDSGGNQKGLKAVAERLNKEWGTKGALYIPEFYDYQAMITYMNEELGIEEPESEGYHDYYWATALQMVTDPETVRYEQRVKAGKATINGVSIAPAEETIGVGKKLMQFRVNGAVKAIRAARGH